MQHMFERLTREPDTFKKPVAVMLCIVLAVILALLGGEWLWWRLANYIQPQDATQKKDLVNVFVLIVGGVVAFLTASAAMGNLLMTRRNLKQQRELDERRAQDDALQSYYEQVGDLLTKHNLRGKQNYEDPVRLLAEAQTQTVFRRVDATRKSDLVRFLSGAQLIVGEHPIIHLSGVNLMNADLIEAELSGAKLSGAYLIGANLIDAKLSGAALSDAYLFDAYLIGADLSGANLSGADLSGANVIGASGANLIGANLIGAKLSGATMPNGLKYEDWIKTQEGGAGSP